MTEKISGIKNPLTIIAIFAGIVEACGTLALPFIGDATNQMLFICFLAVFSLLLLLLFFITLNFNNSVLYGPSDFKDERNYCALNGFGHSTNLSKIDSKPFDLMTISKTGLKNFPPFKNGE